MKWWMLGLFILLPVAYSFEITEIMYNPSDGNEWIEFHTENELNFSGYELIDNLHIDQLVCCGLSCNYIVPENSFFLILDQDSTLNYSGIRFCVDDVTIGNTLGNTNDKIAITKNLITYINISYQKTVVQGNSIILINNSWQETSPTLGYGIITSDEETNATVPDINVSVNISLNTSINVTLPNNCTDTILYVNMTCSTGILNSTIANLSIELEECNIMAKTLKSESEEKGLTITALQSEILNLSLRLAALDGCEFNNPRCLSNETCTDNICSLKPGCQYDNPSCTEGYMCRNNVCIPEERVSFRTNIGNSRYYDKKGEIAVDADGDGNLDCFTYETFNWFYFSQHPIKLLKTMEGYEIHKLARNRILIRDRIRNSIYVHSDLCTIPITDKSLEEYFGREVIK